MGLRRPQSYRSKHPPKWKGNRISSCEDSRTIKLGKTENVSRFPDNEIVSSKYTVWTFLPKNLYEQFRRIANFYFLVMAVIAFAITSPVSPLTSCLPLIFVVFVTAVKQAYEDYLRHRADRDVNDFLVTVIRRGVKMQIPAKKIQVGDIVRVDDEQDIPCDIVLLVSSHKESKCFVTTANLDGETNLKTLYCPKSLKRTMTPEELGQLDATIECESPTPDLYKYLGRLEYGTKTSQALRQSMIKREKISRAVVPRDAQCCYSICMNCPFKKKDQEGFDGGTNDIPLWQMRCDCQCRTRGLTPETPDEAAKTLEDFENSVRALEEKLEIDCKASNRRLSSPSTHFELVDDPLPKMSSNPEMGQKWGHVSQEVLTRPALKKGHKKTASNVSRVSFNVDLSRRDSSTSSSREWTLDRKTTILRRRNSSLLSSVRPSLATPDGTIIDSLGAENLLLRGARLKNTKFVYGCAVYTGQDTKLALNSKITNNKFSTVERSVNKFLVFYIVFLILKVVVSTVLKTLRESNIGFRAAAEKKFKHKLLKEAENPSVGDRIETIVQDFFSFVVLYNYVIPISLYVTMEMQKFLGKLFFEWDLNMYDERTDEAAICNTSDLNEDLGQIEYLFTDKTGTLTENNMQFRRCSVNGKCYQENNGGLYELKKNSDGSTGAMKIDLQRCDAEMERFLLALCLCHTIQVEEKPKKEDDDLPTDIVTDSEHKNEGVLATLSVASSFEVVADELPKYSASSPDEKALVEAMQKLDLIFIDDADDWVVIKIFGTDQIFKRLEVLEFTSDRKRMSVIVEDDEKNLFLYCKGAESAVYPLATSGAREATWDHVREFASCGLRTLMVAYKPITREEYTEMSLKIQKARRNLSAHRDSIVADAYRGVESDLILLGATGIEDKLQDGVKETLEGLRAAGVKVWILTGDKVETAVNISKSCGHIKSNHHVLLELVAKMNSTDCREALDAYSEKINEEAGKPCCLVVDGDSLRVSLQHHRDLFRDVCMKCNAVICCRMSPLQKSEVVALVKTSPGNPVTAAVGDGANDVAMIQEAHVGLGIMGKEGRQAVRSADFAFGRFKFLREALLVHGHWYYLRVATLVQYFFYKNIVFILPQFYFLFFNGHSTQSLYDSMYLTCYNIFFTSLPIVIYGLLEQNFPAKTLRERPRLYAIHACNRLMTWRHFFKWFFLGVWHSLVIFFFPYFWYSINSGLVPDGRDAYSELFGTQIFHSSVVTVNLKLWLHSKYWCWPFIGSIVVSILAWILMASLYSAVNIVITSSMYFTFFHFMASPSMWLMSLLSAAACLVPDLVVDTINNHRITLPRKSPFSVFANRL